MCGAQDVHHGTLIGVVLPGTTRLVARHVPEKARRVRAAMGISPNADIGDALQALIGSLGLPTTLNGAGYRTGEIEPLVADMVASRFNRTSPYAPTGDEYRGIVAAIAG